MNDYFTLFHTAGDTLPHGERGTTVTGVGAQVVSSHSQSESREWTESGASV